MVELRNSNVNVVNSSLSIISGWCESFTLTSLPAISKVISDSELVSFEVDTACYLSCSPDDPAGHKLAVRQQRQQLLNRRRQ